MKFKAALITILVFLVIAAVIVAGVYLNQRKRQQAVLDHLKIAEEALAEGEMVKAEENLQIVLERFPNSTLAPRACFLLARSNFDAHKYDEALEYSERLITEYPESPFVAWAKYYKADVLLRTGGDLEIVEELLEELSDTASDKEVALWADLGVAKLTKKRGNLKQARKMLNELYVAENLPQAIEEEVKEALGEVNMTLLFSPEIAEGDQVYALKKGDTLYDLSRKFKVTQELLMQCNNITDPRMLKVGRQLKIPRGDFSIEVDKSSNRLILFSGDDFFKEYKVRTGKYDYLTPVGDFRIEYKKEDPEWVDPRSHKRYPPGHPENELGTRWMSFKGSALGIHGTIHPDTIGEYASFGCVGMLMDEVEELYDIVPVGTPVKIYGSIRKERETETDDKDE